MNQLYSYISAINQLPSVVSIDHQQQQQQCHTDSIGSLTETDTLYHFNNGVTVRCQIEQEDPATADSLQSCPECWISYHIGDSAGLNIHPASKQFYNRCQQTFWLKMQSAQQKR
ncbi:hypothetical protein NFHSH190041_34250 [Shewanella sp. NFH-SH190041]|uniref:hypothetical protein n=1 Tax=Shewanella sp. NFH-SH190041 TaxID=2950245 RepID=UPI0021C263D7|nr:hypothetical protein [Shewanella sp. NFH-SH190041]BDM65973.1 hypothetical protein NFHSH190041_34250 [Shewanella sp. NFH-SH190041]